MKAPLSGNVLCNLLYSSLCLKIKSVFTIIRIVSVKPTTKFSSEVLMSGCQFFCSDVNWLAFQIHDFEHVVLDVTSLALNYAQI